VHSIRVLAFALLRNQAVGKSKNAQEFSQGGNRLQALNPHGISSWNKWKLVHRPIGVKNPPACALQQVPRLKEQLDAINRLIGDPIRVTDLCIDFIEAHEVKVVGRRKKKHSPGPGDAMELSNTLQGVGQMFDGLAGNDNIEESVGKGKGMGIPLDEAGWCPRIHGLPSLFADRDSGEREINSARERTRAREFPDEPAAAASDLLRAKTFHIANRARNPLVPRSRGVVIGGIKLVVLAVPSIVIGSKAHICAL